MDNSGLDSQFTKEAAPPFMDGSTLNEEELISAMEEVDFKQEPQESNLKNEELPPSYQDSTQMRSDFPNFRSYRYSMFEKDEPILLDHLQPPGFMPSLTEATAHLRLLKAFGVLKKKVLKNFPQSKTESNSNWLWRVFVTVAVRRFIVFISALRHHASKFPTTERKLETTTDARSQRFTAMANQLVPPLDVIMMWHAFMLNPLTYYDVFTRKDMYYFVNYPFPLHILDLYIDGETFEFKVPDESKKKYSAFLGEFTTVAMDLRYDSDLSRFYEQKVTFYSPFTNKPLTDPVPLTTNKAFGFCNRTFSAKTKGHQYQSLCRQDGHWNTITFDELRKVILDFDTRTPRLLEGTLKYYSAVLARPRFSSRNPELISHQISRSVVNSSLRAHMSATNDTFVQSLQEMLVGVASGNLNRRKAENLLLRPYLRFNTVSLTVRKGVNIGEDLVDCVTRQGRFVDKMNNLDWVGSPMTKEILHEALTRYQRFFTLLTDELVTQMVVPTLDIDLMWHTHQLMLYGYFRDCKYSPRQAVVDHNDKVEKIPLDNGFEYTSQLYKERYQDEYCICFCDDCVRHRKSKMSPLTKLFKSLKKLEPIQTLAR
ncbi:hypothetical protein Cantr_10425 [Candida viswanathii]|uniref:Uncharacterized protein n=1 Tax=Candida viswanathii TaxID=5486 RepID=A0A367YEF0_9ASCO|nr:hypothetical protein Cantr_10425 [Candida viswanathii]